MNITFDRKADALYIQSQEGKVARTRKIQDGILVDIDKTGRLFGIEILDVSERIPAESLGVLKTELPIKSAG
jgi:uncharacterized protein YuzE